MRIVRLLTPLLAALLAVVGVLHFADASAEAEPHGPAVWTEAAPLPWESGFYGTTQCQGDHNSFFVLAVDDIVFPTQAGFWRFDAAADQWVTLADYPILKGGVALHCYKGQIYAAGGGLFAGAGFTNAFYIYDVAADAWSAGPTLPRVTGMAKLGAWNGYLFLIGGLDSNLDPIQQVDRYDIAAGTWQADYGQQVPVNATGAGVQAGPYMYIVGGVTQAGNVNSDATLRYDMAHDEWEVGPVFAPARAAIGLAITSQYLYAIGGDAPGGGWWNVSSAVERLDWTAWPSGTWESVAQLPYRVEGNFAGACTESITGGEVWSAGGATGYQVYTDTNLYLPAEPCYTGSYSVTVDTEMHSNTAMPGFSVAYRIPLTNTGTAYDSYTTTISSEWPALVADPGVVEPFASAAIIVTVTVPVETPIGATDVATVTVTSNGNPGLSLSIQIETTALVLDSYLPVIAKP